MKLKYYFEVLEMDNEFVAVPVGNNASEFSGIVRINKAAAEIFDLLKEDTSEEEVINTLYNKYENEQSEITKYVKDFVAALRAKKLIIE